MFQFAPVSDRIRRIREKKDVFTSGKHMTIILNAQNSIPITSGLMTMNTPY